MSHPITLTIQAKPIEATPIEAKPIKEAAEYPP